MSSSSTPGSNLRLRLSALLILLTALAVPARVQAQSAQFTTNTADQSLRGSLQVDPSTLGMSFSLPLANYPGRGLSLPVTLNYSSKLWRMQLTEGFYGHVAYYTITLPR